MKLFFLYDTQNAEAAAAARQFAAHARVAGHESCDPSFSDIESRIREARLLFIFFDKMKDVYSSVTEEYWRMYGGGESEGEIICVLGGRMEKDMLPFALHSCKILRYGDTAALAETLKPSSKPAQTAAPPPKPPVVTAPPKPAQTITPTYKPAPPPARPAVNQQPCKPSYTEKPRPRRNTAAIVKSACDWVWLIALIPLSVGVMYGVSAVVNKLNTDSFFTLLLITGAFAFLLSPAVSLPFCASRYAYKCVRYFRLAAIAACLAADIIFINFYAPAAYIPEINMALRGVCRAIACAAMPAVFFAAARLIKKIKVLNFRFSPLAAYLACHATDGFLMNTGYKLAPLILLMFVFLALGMILNSVLRAAVKNRVFIRCLNALGYAAFLALFVAALLIGNPFFSIL